MRDPVTICLNGDEFEVSSGITVAVAILQSNHLNFRTSVTGEPRAPFCGMGICYECRVTIDGHAHVRSCQIMVRAGMQVRT